MKKTNSSINLLPEWHPADLVQLTWPHEGTDWKEHLAGVNQCYIQMAKAIAQHAKLLVVSPKVSTVRNLLDKQLAPQLLQNVIYVECPTDDTWARDHAFLTTENEGKLQLLDFQFNGWGGKFYAKNDNAINKNIFHQHLFKADYVDYLDFILEGGSIESDGEGTLLTTTRCLLNPNRNPQLNKEDIVHILAERLGAKQILWLEHGYLAGDDTDSHIDTLARLCPNETILYVQCSDPSDEHYEELLKMEEQLRTFVAPSGNPYTLIPLPHPQAVFDEEGERLPATYANYLVVNDAVLMPTYNQPEADQKAHNALLQAFPHHEIINIDCRVLILQHGSLHCSTMQYPKGTLNQL